MFNNSFFLDSIHTGNLQIVDFPNKPLYVKNSYVSPIDISVGQILLQTPSGPTGGNIVGAGGINVSLSGQIYSTITDDAIPITLCTLPISANSTVMYDASIVAKSNISIGSASYKMICGFENHNGNITQIGNTTYPYRASTNDSASAFYTVNNGNIDIQVTGQYPRGGNINGPEFYNNIPIPIPLITTRTIRVGTLGGEDFTEISSAIASANNGDRILLSPQTFTLTTSLNITKPIFLEGISKTLSIIQTAGGSTDPTTVITIASDNVIISNLTVKQRRTTNSSIESAIVVAFNGSVSSYTNHFFDNIVVETMEFGIVIRSNRWQISNSHLAYVGPNNSTRRLLAIYRSDGIGIFTNSTYDSGQNGIVTGNTQVISITSTTGLPLETLGGYLCINNIRPSNNFPLQQFFNCDSFRPGTSPLRFVVNNCRANETSAFVVFFLSSSQPPLSQCEYIAILNNNISGQHNNGTKGLISLDGSQSGNPGSTILYADRNTIANTVYRPDFQSGIMSNTNPQILALLGYKVGIWSNPNINVSPIFRFIWSWKASISEQRSI